MANLWQEYPEIKVDIDILKSITARVIENKEWIPDLGASFGIHRKSKLLELHEVDMKIDLNPTMSRIEKREEFIKRSILTYSLTQDEKDAARIYSDTAKIFYTAPDKSPPIHREARARALNIPIIFEPGKSSVAFYDIERNELERHILWDFIPVRFKVDQWHTVHNESIISPRVVLTCSKFTGPWEYLLNDTN